MGSNPVESLAGCAIEDYRRKSATYFEALKQWVKIPSVSFPGYDSLQLNSAAQAISDRFDTEGLGPLKELETAGGPPCLFGQWDTGDENLPTVLLYSHYDIQPPLSEDLWQTPPFEACERSGRLYGRGTADDKGGIAVHLAALASFLRTSGRLPVNVKLLLEGEEEIGSPHLEETLSRHLDLLKADAIIILDGSNFAAGLPTVTSSMRGLVALTVTVSSAERALHSGLWGGPIPDPALALAKVLAGLQGPDGRVGIPELRQGACVPTGRERSDIASLNVSAASFRDQAKLYPQVDVLGEGDEILHRLWHEPSISINSMVAGDRKTAGNVILNSAWARIGLRLAPGMDPAKALEALARHLRRECPWNLRLEITFESNSSAGWKADVSHPAYALAQKSYSQGYGRSAIFAGNGATVPIVAMMAQKMPQAAPILVGILDPDSNPHSENESLLIADFHHAVESEILFLAEMAHWNRP